MGNKKSFKERVEKTNHWLVAFVSIVVVLFCIVAYWNSSCYNRIFEGYSDLQQYYEAVKQCGDDMKKYLTVGEEEYLNEYKLSMLRAKTGIRDLLENPIMNDKWRFHLLKNMLIEYEGSVQELMEQYMKNEDAASYRSGCTGIDLFDDHYHFIDNSFLDSIYLKAVLSYDFKAPAKSIGEYSFDQTGRI